MNEQDLCSCGEQSINDCGCGAMNESDNGSFKNPVSE